MNSEKIISDEIRTINADIEAANNQYVSQTPSKNSVPPDFHILFILIKHLAVDNVSYDVDSLSESIFYEAVENFKYSVESFSNQNVHIIPTIKIINDPISINNRNIVYVGDVESYLNNYSAAGLYDSVMVITSDCLGGAVTSLAMFEWNKLMFGFTHSVILLEDDRDLVNKGYSNDYPHLHTTGYMLHEWLHQLSGYGYKLDVFFPDIHGYTNTNLYSWDDSYFDNCPHVVSAFHNSFYRAILCAALEYHNGSDSIKTGVYPLFWKITPRKVLIGKYIIQNQSNEYCYNNNGTIGTSTTLANSLNYYWNVYYDFAIEDMKITNFTSSPVSTTTNDYTFTRVGPYDEGMYYLVDLSLNNQILGYTTSYVPEMTTYRSSPRQSFYSEYSSELFATLSTAKPNQNTKLLKLYNSVDAEAANVVVGDPTNASNSQIWQFRFSENRQNYQIMPKLSPLRSLSFYSSTLHITQNTNTQYWRPELIANGKFIFNGKYKIFASTGGFLTFSGNTLKLSTTGTEWNITFHSDNYYQISCINGSNTYYFDVMNAYDYENNPVQVQYGTSYTDAQTWKFMINSDGKVIIVPRLSLTKGIKSTFSSSVLSSNPTLFTLIKI